MQNSMAIHLMRYISGKIFSMQALQLDSHNCYNADIGWKKQRNINRLHNYKGLWCPLHYFTKVKCIEYYISSLTHSWVFCMPSLCTNITGSYVCKGAKFNCNMLYLKHYLFKR